MIPRVIQPEHVNAAMDEIDRDGVPAARDSRKFFVWRGGKKYPPKYVISIACRIATGKDLDPATFNGGAETNNALQKLGFSIGPHDLGATGTCRSTEPRSIKMVAPSGTPSANHNERCPECKNRVELMLKKLYQTVIRNAEVSIPATPDRLDHSPTCHTLRVIYTALQNGRGFQSFVRRETLPRCDFLVPNPGFIVEFDESQHFTPIRKLTLGYYPSDLHFGFDRTMWVQLCDEFQRHDNDPPFRDEQRAWYDTLRDFAPYIQNSVPTLPTLRLYAGEYEWCTDFNPERTEDIETFRQLLGKRANFWQLDFHADRHTKPKLARIIVDGSWCGDQIVAHKLLADICGRWPPGLRVKCLSTPGAFLRFNWPDHIRPQEDNRFPTKTAIQQLDAAARPHIEKLLDNGLRQRLAGHSDYLSIGIDTNKEKISSTDNFIGDCHAELVYVVDLQSGDMFFTGKSYPTSGQEKGLLRIADLNSHFVNLGGEQVMVLGCHDLTMFNPRSDAKASAWRATIKRKFKNLAQQYAPTMVLHHPHTTVKKRTWLQAWSRLLKEVPSVSSYVGTGCYSFRDKNGSNRDSLNNVLQATRSRDTLDIIVSMARL